MPLKSDEENKCKKIFTVNREKVHITIWHKKNTVDDIVAEAKIAKGTFYLYFKSREDFFYQLLVAINQNLFRLAEETVLKNLDKNIKSAIQKFLENLFDTPEIGFYFREHKEIDKSTEKFSAENYADT